MKCFGVHTAFFPFFANNDFTSIYYDWHHSNEQRFSMAWSTQASMTAGLTITGSAHRVDREARRLRMTEHGLEVALVGYAEPRKVCLSFHHFSSSKKQEEALNGAYDDVVLKQLPAAPSFIFHRSRRIIGNSRLRHDDMKHTASNDNPFVGQHNSYQVAFRRG